MFGRSFCGLSSRAMNALRLLVACSDVGFTPIATRPESTSSLTICEVAESPISPATTCGTVGALADDWWYEDIPFPFQAILSSTLVIVPTSDGSTLGFVSATVGDDRVGQVQWWNLTDGVMLDGGDRRRFHSDGHTLTVHNALGTTLAVGERSPWPAPRADGWVGPWMTYLTRAGTGVVALRGHDGARPRPGGGGATSLAVLRPGDPPSAFGPYNIWPAAPSANDAAQVPPLDDLHVMVGANVPLEASETTRVPVMVPDVDGDGWRDLASAPGIQSGRTGRTITPWLDVDPARDTQTPFIGSPVTGRDGAVRVWWRDDYRVFLSNLDGTLAWSRELDAPVNPGYVPTVGSAFADTDGDGTPELCTGVFSDTLVLLDLDGEVRWRAPRPIGVDPYQFSACAMADLDADGAYEVIELATDGVFVRDGRDGSILYEDLTARGDYGLFHSPVIADIDGDGSSEIIIVGGLMGTPAESLGILRIYRPTTGRWSRGRPVWNQYNYDVTSITDQGTLALDPIPNWESYNTWRAQPPHDGDLPDLAPLLLAACDAECDEGRVIVDVAVQNSGSQPSEPTRVSLRVLDDGSWVEVAATTINGLEPGTATDPIRFDVPLAEWRAPQVLVVETPAGTPECDRVNDRLDLDLHPCGIPRDE
jgi:hypothetical protein